MAPAHAHALELPPPMRPHSAPERDEQARTVEALLRSAITLLEVDDESEVLQRYCDALTSQLPQLLLAWTWFGPPDTPEIRPQVYAGAAAGYARELRVLRRPTADQPPAFRALAGERLAVFGSLQFETLGVWRELAQSHGVRNVLALPLKSSVDDQRGVFLLYASSDGYFERVGLGLFEALADLFSAVLSRAARHAALSRAATRDALTGLLNRQALPMLAQRLQRRSGDDPPAALVLLDLDHFKRINDTHGHPAGDQVLHGVAQALQSSLRSGDLCLRWGGEEFLLALPGTDARQAQVVVEKLRQRLRDLPHALTDGLVLNVSASFGVADLKSGESIERAIARADAALYAAKRGGRNRVVMD